MALLERPCTAGALDSASKNALGGPPKVTGALGQCATSVVAAASWDDTEAPLPTCAAAFRRMPGSKNGSATILISVSAVSALKRAWGWECAGSRRGRAAAVVDDPEGTCTSRLHLPLFKLVVAGFLEMLPPRSMQRGFCTRFNRAWKGFGAMLAAQGEADAPTPCASTIDSRYSSKMHLHGAGARPFLL
jgi:hypothetical protein